MALELAAQAAWALAFAETERALRVKKPSKGGG